MAFFVIKDKQTNQVLREGSCLPTEIPLQVRSENEVVEEVESLTPPDTSGPIFE